jgi:hypothetical protein
LFFGGEAISLVVQEIASGKERPRNDMNGNWSDHETMMIEKFGKDLTPHQVKYRMLKR